MKGRVITKGETAQGAFVTALICDGRVEDIEVHPKGNANPMPAIGQVCYATITRILPNGRGAFCDLASGLGGFLRDSRDLRQGTRLPVQIASLPEVGKALPVRRNPLIKGPRVILTPAAPGINASRKLTDPEEKDRLTNAVAKALRAWESKTPASAELGAIIRTSAEGVAADRITAEVCTLLAAYRSIEMGEELPRTTWFTKPGLLSSDIVVEWLSETPDAILLDPSGASIAVAGLREHGPLNLWGDAVLADRIETDPNPLDTASVLACLDALQTPDVALATGSMIVEPTRALVAVDVNTGADFSAAAGLKANLSAARELPRQLRLRGLGGQIVVDFAPMPKKDRRTLEEALRKAFRADPVETSLVGWTTLGHYELQRRRERRPLHEVL
ncbi:MAG: ribonuclease E/G [Pseudomonadota bacterium]